MVKCRSIRFEDMKVVIGLLKLISDFVPGESEYEKIWKEYSEQNNVFGIVEIRR